MGPQIVPSELDSRLLCIVFLSISSRVVVPVESGPMVGNALRIEILLTHTPSRLGVWLWELMGLIMGY